MSIVRRFLPLFVFLMLFTLVAMAQQRINACHVKKEDVGEERIVCGTVTNTRYVDTGKTNPTFLNMGGRYPQQCFTVVIWGEDRKQFIDDLRAKHAESERPEEY